MSGSATQATPSTTPTAPQVCPVTLPVHDMFGNSVNYGNGSLDDGLDPFCVTLITPGHGSPPEGPYSEKVGWWRSVSGHLTTTGRRLDGDAPSLTDDIPSGYGDAGFQVSSVNYLAKGCWDVTGYVRSVSLTVVTTVVYVDTSPYSGSTPTPGAATPSA